jgi:hypothetical protein
MIWGAFGYRAFVCHRRGDRRVRAWNVLLHG